MYVPGVLLEASLRVICKVRLADGRLATVSPPIKPLYKAPAYAPVSASTLNLASLAAVTKRLAGVMLPVALVVLTV